AGGEFEGLGLAGVAPLGVADRPAPEPGGLGVGVPVQVPGEGPGGVEREAVGQFPAPPVQDVDALVRAPLAELRALDGDPASDRYGWHGPRLSLLRWPRRWAAPAGTECGRPVRRPARGPARSSSGR